MTTRKSIPRIRRFFTRLAISPRAPLAARSPRVRGEGWDEGAKTCVQICGAQNRGEAPSPSLCSTSPRARGEVKMEIRPRDASASELCPKLERRSGLCEAIRRSPSKRRASGNKRGRRSAGRRTSHSPHRTMRPRAQRSPLAFRRSTAALAGTSERSSSAQAALHANQRTRALSAPSFALKQGTLHAGRNAGGALPGPPGSEVTSFARRNRTRSASGIVSRSVPHNSTSEMMCA